MSAETRGYGTMIVATIGILGAVVASFVGDLFDWRIAYFVGGGMGLALLILRIGVAESGMFQGIKRRDVARGDFLSLFLSPAKRWKYLRVILIAVPIWYVVGILITFSPEFGRSMGMAEIPNPGRAVMFAYIGLAIGDFSSGFLSQRLRSRNRIVGAFLGLTTACIAVYFVLGGLSLGFFYSVCVALGFSTGYSAVFVTLASEQFGTNIRATVTTTAPNFVRGAVVPLTSAFELGRQYLGIQGSAILVGAASLVVAFAALRRLEETYGKNLDYVEP